MRINIFGVACAALLGLSACGDTDLERGLSGAVIGGVGAEVAGGDAGSGAIMGGLAGVFCDDVGAC